MTAATTHCPDCGALLVTRRDGLWAYLICPDDDCPRIVGAVIAQPRANDPRLGKPVA